MKKDNLEVEQRRSTHRDQLLTLGDLEIFRISLIQEIKTLLTEIPTANAKKWLKSTEVKKLLGMSTGTLQTLRMNGTLSHSKIGGIIYYNQEEILKLLKDNEQR